MSLEETETLPCSLMQPTPFQQICPSFSLVVCNQKKNNHSEELNFVREKIDIYHINCNTLYLNSSESYSPCILRFFESKGDFKCNVAGWRTPNASISYSPDDSQLFVTFSFSGWWTYLFNITIWIVCVLQIQN